MKLILPYPPTANLYWRHFRNRVVVSDKARKYRERVKLQARVDGLTPLEGNVRLTVYVYRPRKSGDLDNTLKVLIDALGGCAYLDDKQIVAIHAHRLDDKLKPRVEVYVWDAPPEVEPLTEVA